MYQKLSKEGEYYKNIYVDATLQSEDKDSVSMGIGNSKISNENIINTYIYKYSKINDEYINEIIDTYKQEQYVNGDDLRLEQTYRSTFGWNGHYSYIPLQSDSYPTPKNVKNATDVKLPTDQKLQK